MTATPDEIARARGMRRYNPPKRSGKTPEAKVSGKVDDYLKELGCINIRTNSGSWQDDAGHWIMGSKAGTSDKTCCLPNGRFCAVETKSAKGKLSEAQERYKARVLRLGGIYIEARSKADVRAGLVDAFGEEMIKQWEGRS
jgi:hypothetical protein